MTVHFWPSLRGVHVFAVDDNDDSRRLLTQALEYCGALVSAFPSAEAAMTAMNECVPTLIVSDIAMPEVSGLDFIRRLRARAPDKGGRIPAIAVTAYYEEFAAGAARAAGFEGFLTKPLDFGTLCMVVGDVVALTRYRDEPAA
ncbi:MAG TPA: response regulator [Methylomirabilota bacterium]|jgi:CheY-like chemotaxis protein|nr:response regulator [Methylomirabilota bacterium]